MSALTVAQIDRAKPAEAPYKLRDGKGLYLEVRPTGAKFWRYRFRLPGETTEKMFTIGEYGSKPGQCSLAAARDARSAARALVKQGVNPTEHRGQIVTTAVAEGKNTFRAVAREWLDDSKPHWSAKYLSQVEAGLDRDILPTLGDRPIRSITSADVLAIIKARKSTPTWALLLRQWVGAIFRYAIAHRRADEDPTYAVRGTIKRPAVKHHAPLKLREIPAFLTALRADTGERQTIIAVELLLLTFVRPSELAKAEWREFALDDALWIIPGKRMKMREDHYVPLSSQAVKLLRELHKLTGHRQHLFPNARDPRKPMDSGSLNRIFSRIGYGDHVSPHSCRSTASTALNEMGYRFDLIERQLAHAERNKSRASYNQAQYMDERRQMMQQWANVISAKPGAKVIPLKGAA